MALHDVEASQLTATLKPQELDVTEGEGTRGTREPRDVEKKGGSNLGSLCGSSATTTPAVLFDSFNGDGGKTKAGFGDKEDDSSQQASGETGFPNIWELSLTLVTLTLDIQQQT
ncbi:hypothetical protein UY3_02780 [Chelonia mydas]|uniref:Uncharacterized protein n=1 Tax=Chelonia mydas TaxID=8469 RepID=M7CGE2_CHEMY|nr:hypothetical protein UY3_02780 [Chelonia mydas]